MSLSDIFSSSSQSKFDRLIKPEEIKPTAHVFPPSNSTNSNDSSKPKKKKPKHAKNDSSLKPRSDKGESSLEENDNEDENLDNNVDHEKDNIDKSNRTLFVGNLTVSMTIKEIKKLCSEYGEVESVRLRSVPIAGTAVDQAGNQDLVRKVCSIQKKFGDQKGSMNAYVVFKEEDSVAKALVANNTFLNNRHVRMDRVVPSILEPKRTVFIGSLHHYVDEEDLRNHFAKVLPNGQEDIECVRVIRDPDTLVGKGIAYVSFTSTACILQALSLHQKLFKKRELRVTICSNSKAPKRDRDNNTLTKTHINQNTAFMVNKQKRKLAFSSSAATDSSTTTPPSSSSSFTNNRHSNSGNNSSNSKNQQFGRNSNSSSRNDKSTDAPRVKKPRHIPRVGSVASNSSSSNTNDSSSTPYPRKPMQQQQSSSSANATNNSVMQKKNEFVAFQNANRRINLKSVVTRNKVLVGKGQKQGKGQKAKTKEVSGSVKRAIKAAHMNRAAK